MMNIIHPKAALGENVEVGAFTSIAEDVVIGEGTWIGQNVVIADGVRIGKNCRIFHGAVLGSVPQDLKFEDEETILEIGDNVVIREYCTLNRGTKENHKTSIGDNCLIMAYVHVAHDCMIGKHCIIANAVNMGGHVEIGDFTVIGGMTAIHQFVKIGDSVMVSGGSLIRKDIPPFIKVAREPLSYVGINSIGLRRRGFSNKQIVRVQDIYRIFFVKGYNTRQALSYVEADLPESAEKTIILNAMGEMDRGLVKGFRTGK